MSKPKQRRSVTDFRLVPVDKQAERRRLLWLLLLGAALLLAGLVIGFFCGQSGSSNQPSPVEQQHVASLQQKVDQLHQQLALYETSSTISSEAKGQLQDTFRQLHSKIGELKKALVFYKNIMAPANRQEGLHIEHLQVTSEGDHRYRFMLVLTQIGNNKWRPYLTGNVSWQIIGTQNGEPATLAQSVFVNSSSDTHFGFHYFQELRGTLTLPANFQPEKVVIHAASKKQRPYQRQHTFLWAKLEQMHDGT